MNRTKYNPPVAASASINQPDEKAKRQIFILMASALVLFLGSTFVLVEMLPSPSAHVDSMMAGVDSAMIVHYPPPRPRTMTMATTNKMEAESVNSNKNPQHLRHHNKRLVRNKKPDSRSESQMNNIAVENHAAEGVTQKLIGSKNHANAIDQISKSAAQPSMTTDPNKEYAKSKPQTNNFAVENHSEGATQTTQKSIASKSAGRSDNVTAGHNQQDEQRQKNHPPAIIDQISKPAAHQSIPTDTESNDEYDDPRLIHILETRFMQNQPNLIQLAKARIHLLKTICLPTVLGQTAWGEFLWVIRTDPALDDGIKEELVQMLKDAGALVQTDEDTGEERAMTYVIGSNDNYIVSNSTTSSVRPFDIRAMLSDALSKPASIFAGKAESIQLLYDEVSSKKIAQDVLLWTRLDADDGLNIGYMEYIQSQAIRYFIPDRYDREIMKEIPEKIKKEKPVKVKKEVPVKSNATLKIKNQIPEKIEKEIPETIKQEIQVKSNATKEPQKLIKNTFTPPQWTYWCASLNIDWFLTNPIHDPHHKNGTVYPVMHVNACVTPGVTVALRGSFDPLKVPRLDHDKIISYLRPQGGKICSRTGLSVFDPQKTIDEGYQEEEVDDGSCFHMVRGGISKIASIRSRTPTSAGMMGVNPDPNQMASVKKTPKLTPVMWQILTRHFKVKNEDLLKTNAYFAEHIYDIAEENARGQCTAGHSCKSSSKDLLQQYVDLKGEMAGGFDIIEGKII